MRGRLNTVGRIGVLDMSVGGYQLIRPIAGFPAPKLVGVLTNEIEFQAVACGERQGLLNDSKFPKAGKLINHKQGAVLVALNYPALQIGRASCRERVCKYV